MGGEGLLYQQTTGTCFGPVGSGAVPSKYYCHYATAGFNDYVLGMHIVSYWEDKGDSQPSTGELLRAAPAGYVDANSYTAITLVDEDQGFSSDPEWLCDPDAGCDGTDLVIGGATLSIEWFQPMKADSYTGGMRIDAGEDVEYAAGCISTLNEFTSYGTFTVTGATMLATGATFLGLLSSF
jgi:hypothetical protein